ncbi:hypothetical protein [Pseudomonas sp. KNUC1026]|uniref:hypothetical protein n=1 Tax=Pseudomonas sp. KNUC1026 TaxID=2893890 RepID=UPI001F2E15D2|nr:hypothetical protein [Pseudomonas sp. KNUC1026]UFH50542.1 hypothetical protein LN139_04790 [Pseudomonas sp. KNUC1026]
MKRCVVALAILALAGCATYRMGQARDAGPIATLESARLPVDMAQCVETTWQLESLFGPDADAFTDRDGKGRFTVLEPHLYLFRRHRAQWPRQHRALLR